MNSGWFTPLSGNVINPLVPDPEIEPLDQPDVGLAPSPLPGRVRVPIDPWNPGATTRAPASAVSAAARLALGVNLTTTPEYLAANLPPYNR